MVKETVRKAIVDWNGGNKLASVVESLSSPWTYWLVALWPDWSPIGWWDDNFSYEEVHEEVTIPLYQQMIVMWEQIVEDVLIIEWTLVLET